MSDSKKQHVLSHYDPAVEEVHRALSVAQEKGAAKEVLDAIQSALNLVTLREDFTENYTTTPSAACQNILKQTYATDWKAIKNAGKTSWSLAPRMMSGPLEGQFLKSVVSMSKAKRVLDIGMYTGYSALAMAESLPADGEVVTLDKEPFLESFTRALFDESPHSKKIKISIGGAIEYMKKEVEEGRKFDMMFLDAEKSEYKDYLDIAFKEGLLAAGGTILVDNVYMHGRGYMGEGDNPIKQFAAKVMGDDSLHSVLVPIRDGVLMLRRKSEVEGSV